MEPVVILDGGQVGHLELYEDMRDVSLRGAKVESFDARGKKLTLEFFANAKFETLLVDETTEVYMRDGRRLGRATALEDGDHFILAVAQ